MSLVHLQVRNPRDDETPIEAASQIFASLLSSSHVPLWRHPIAKPRAYAFELFLLGQTIYYYVTVPEEVQTLVSSLISSTFPASTVQKTTDPMETVFKSKHIEMGRMNLNSSFYLPIKTYMDFRDVDPMSALIGFLSKQEAGIRAAIQIIVTPASFPWQASAMHAAKAMSLDSPSGRYTQNPSKLLIMRKASFQGGKVSIRLVVGTQNPALAPLSYLQNLAGTFGTFSLGEGNQLSFKRRKMMQDRLAKRIRERRIHYFENRHQILNAQELATIWHPPGLLMAGIKNIGWGKTLSGEPPENLPIATNPTFDKQDLNFFAKTEFKNRPTIFGISTKDRRKHVYIVGKTGAGKTTLISNMAIDDIRKDRGLGIIDPHGDLTNAVLDYIPKRRMQDVVYLEPFDQERPFSLNVLEVRDKQHKDLVASGIVSIFFKLYGDSWGPRLEYILRNVIMTLLEIPGSTLPDILTLLSDAPKRRELVAKHVTDPVILAFWNREFDMMSDKLRTEAISPIQNKVGQFVSSRMIRNIIGNPKSSIDLRQIMDEKKILLLNLSQGKLGEDNAALLGAMMITQIQLSAMGRSYQAEEDRQDFFLYVDEFQNFATNSFVKILSEARKYRLSLTLANQYIEQLDETIQHAIFGNVGTLISFVVGARDARILSKEYGEIYTEADLVGLGKHEVVMKLSIDDMTSTPFPAKTLPPPEVKNENAEKIVELSKQRFGRTVNK